MKNIFFLFILASLGCNPDDPEPEDGGGGNNPSTENYYLKYTDGGQLKTFEGSTGVSVIGDLESCSDNNYWYDTGMSFDEPGASLFDQLQLLISLPSDSSRMSEIMLNHHYEINNEPINGAWSCSNPGSVYFYQSTAANGTDRSVSDIGSSEYYHKITNVQYIGNRTYNQIIELMVCYFEITGEFRIRVENDVTDQIRVLENGQYKMKVYVLAE